MITLCYSAYRVRSPVHTKKEAAADQNFRIKMALAEMLVFLAICVAVYSTTAVTDTNGTVEQPAWAEGVTVATSINSCIATCVWVYLRRCGSLAPPPRGDGKHADTSAMYMEQDPYALE